MGGYTNFGSLDDGLTGDGIGSGFTDSIASWSGDPAEFDLQDTSNVTGSDIPLDSSEGSTGLSIDDLGTLGTLHDSNSLSGISDGAPDAFGDSYEFPFDTNGEGTATQALTAKAPMSTGSSGDILASLSAFGKFGASIAGVLSGNHPATIGGVPIGARGSVAYDANGRPIVGPGLRSASISGSHTTLIVAVVLGIAVVLMFVPGARKAVQ